MEVFNLYVGMVQKDGYTQVSIALKNIIIGYHRSIEDQNTLDSICIFYKLFRKLRCNCIRLGYRREKRNCLWASWSSSKSNFYSISIIFKSINVRRGGWKFGAVGHGHKTSWGMYHLVISYSKQINKLINMVVSVWNDQFIFNFHAKVYSLSC